MEKLGIVEPLNAKNPGPRRVIKKIRYKND
jgi:hypothetical protein